MKISIILPARDAALYLRETLISIQNQSEVNWECILINDYSQDETLAIAKEFQQSDERFNVIDNTEKGLISALRFGYSNATGEFIHRMDADDLMPPNKLEVLKSNLLLHGLGHVAVGQVSYFSEQELGNGYARYETWLNDLTATGSNFDEMYKECVIPSPCWMVYRQDFERCGAFDSDIYPEDYDLAFRFYESGLKVIPCSDVLHLWRDHADRFSRNAPHYADNAFLDIKCHYFLKLHHNPDRKLLLWSAGQRGKKIAKILIKQGVDFLWYTNNPKKIGKIIYDQTMQSTDRIFDIADAQTIIAVSNPNEQKSIKNMLEQKGRKTLSDFFFFS